MEPSLDSWTVIFLIAACQGVFLSVLIAFDKRMANASRKLLASAILGFSLILLYCVAFWTNYMIYLPQWSSLVLQFTYLIGPAMLLYISIAKFSPLRSNYWLHGIPFIIHIITVLIANALIREQLVTILSVMIVLQNIHLLIYATLIIREAYRSHTPIWLKNISIAYGGYALCFFSYYVMSWVGILEIQYDYIVSAGMTIFIYFVGYYSYHHQFTIAANHARAKKYMKSSLTPQASLHIFEQLQQYLADQKPYLDSQLTLHILAKSINTTTHILSQVINEHAGKNFSELINSMRVQYAMHLMKEENYAQEKIITIAYDSGFNNKVSFHNAFKKVTGITPTQYRKQLPSLGKMSMAS